MSGSDAGVVPLDDMRGAPAPPQSREMRLLALLGVVFALPGSAVQIARGPGGGTGWQQTIPDSAVPWHLRPTVYYLPPGGAPGRRYPLVVFLHGFPGSPYEFVDGLRLAQTADTGIADGALPPFVAVVPPAGRDVHHGDWSGVWEDYLVQQILPWVDAHLPVLPGRGARTLAGLSAGGYGALDIGLRHPTLFGTLEAWSGYFRPLREGWLAHAGRRTLDAHDPSILAEREARLLRALGTRVFLSSGTTHDRETAAGTKAFAGELRALRIPHELVLAPGGHNGSFWRRELPAALAYALHGARSAG
jgi:enterochelin esterase-like enzyme